jgi:glutamyl-tRNA reductase
MEIRPTARHRTMSRSIQLICRSNSKRGFATATKARVVVVGSGRMGTIRAALVQSNPRYELAGIVDPVRDRAKSLADKHGVRFVRWDVLSEQRV